MTTPEQMRLLDAMAMREWQTSVEWSGTSLATVEVRALQAMLAEVRAARRAAAVTNERLQVDGCFRFWESMAFEHDRMAEQRSSVQCAAESEFHRETAAACRTLAAMAEAGRDEVKP